MERNMYAGSHSDAVKCQAATPGCRIGNISLHPCILFVFCFTCTSSFPDARSADFGQQIIFCPRRGNPRAYLFSID